MSLWHWTSELDAATVIPHIWMLILQMSKARFSRHWTSHARSWRQEFDVVVKARLQKLNASYVIVAGDVCDVDAVI